MFFLSLRSVLLVFNGSGAGREGRSHTAYAVRLASQVRFRAHPPPNQIQRLLVSLHIDDGFSVVKRPFRANEAG